MPRKCYNRNSTSGSVIWTIVWSIPQLNIHTLHDLVILPLSLHLTEMHKYVHQKIGTKPAALLVIAPNWTQLKKPSTVEWRNCVYSHNDLDTMRINELLLVPTPWWISLMLWGVEDTREYIFIYKVWKWAKQKHGDRSQDSKVTLGE